MNQWKIKIFFVIFCFVQSTESKFQYNATNFTYRCDPSYARLETLVSLEKGNVGAMRFTNFKKLRNIFISFATIDPKSSMEFFNQSINVCSLGKNRSNIFIRLFCDYFLGSIPDMANFKCPLDPKTIEIPERSTESFAENVSKYLPSFAKLQGKYLITFKVFTKDRNENIAICEIKEIWSFKFWINKYCRNAWSWKINNFRRNVR